MCSLGRALEHGLELIQILAEIVRPEFLSLRHLPKETGIETSPEALRSQNMSDLQGFETVFDRFQ